MRNLARSFGLALAVALGAGLAARAADEKNEPKYKYHDTHHHKHEVDLAKPDDEKKLIEHLKKGEVLELELNKPISPMAWAWDTAIWSVVVFVLLLLILRKFAWGPMVEGLQKREKTIRDAVEEAKKARDETARVTARFQAEMTAKMAEIPKIMEQARRDAEQLKEEMRAQAAKDIQAERQRLRREIETARDQALQELWTRAVQLATLISAKAIGRGLSEEDHRRLVDEALHDLVQRQN